MLAYRYDKDTKEFRFILEAQKNPRGEDYLLPALSTFLQPKECGEHEINVFENEEWVVKKDYRGHYQVNLSNLSFSPVNYIGDAEDGYQLVTIEEYNKFLLDKDSFKVIDGKFIDVTDTQEYKELKLQKQKEIKCNEAKVKAERFLNNEAAYKLGKDFHVEATKNNMCLMYSFADAIEKGIIQSQPWVSKEGSKLELNKEQCLRVFLGIKEIQDDVFCNQYFSIQTQIKNAKTIEELDKVEISYE